MAEEKRERKVWVSKCWDCKFCGPLHSKRKVAGEWRYTKMCRLHGIEVGESSATCGDATNLIPMFGWQSGFARQAKSEDGWDDY